MRFIGKGIQRFTAVSFALTIVASASVAAAGYPSCPHGATCLQVATGTGNGCTLDNAIVAAEYGETTNGCNPNGATVLLLASTTYYAQNTLYVEGITLLGTGATGSTPTVISFRNVTGGNVAMYFDSLGPQQGGELQDLQVIAGGSTATLTGVQSDVFGSVLDHVVISGFNNSGAINNGGLTIHNSTIERNSADFGGGILDNGGILAIDRSSILNNSALGGAGLDVEQGAEADLAYVTIAYNSAEVGGGVSASGVLKAWHATVILNTSSLPWSAIPCGPGGGVYAPTSGGASADWNGSIISGNTDATQADDLVGNLHTASELSDGANPSIVGNAQLNNKSCKAGNWRWVPLGGEGTYALNDQQATLTQLFGSSNPTLGSHPSTAPTQDFALVKGSPAIQACQLANTPYSGDNFGSYQGGAFSGDQGGQTAPGVKGTNYCIGSFEYQ